MAGIVIDGRDSDIELAVKLRDVLTGYPYKLTPFREQLLDVIVANAESLFSYKEDEA